MNKRLKRWGKDWIDRISHDLNLRRVAATFAYRELADRHANAIAEMRSAVLP